VAALPKPVLAEGPLRDLFDELHALHHRAGWPSLRDIAREVGCSHTTVSGAFSDARLPRWGLLELVVEAIGGDTAEFHALWLKASAGGEAAVTAPSAPSRKPSSTGAAAAGSLVIPPPLVRPRQLISDVARFAGRRDELASLADLLSEGGGAPVPIVVVSGTAGVGKTALAVHWAHRIAARFPDGQLFVNLRGFDPTAAPVAPARAVRALLDAFEVPPGRIPASFEAQVALYRSILAERRVLVVLDNARDAEQVRPLLPGAEGCLTVVTSRETLSGLVVSEGAVPVVLDLMPVDEARELIAKRVGDRRVAAEPAAVERIVTRCAGLPLALAVVAARAATHPRFALAAVADELGSLDVFGGPDVATDVRAVLSWSYLQLSDEAARLFRLLGLHPGPDVAAPAVASLAGTSLPQARTLLAELARTNLVTENAPNRYRFHDLLRLYASELVGADEQPPGRDAALTRLLDHYLHTAHRAALLLNPNRHPITLEPAAPGARPEPLADRDRALAWLAAEHPVLVPVSRHAADEGFDRHTWQLAWTLTTFLDRRGHWEDRVAMHERAVASARRLADPDGLSYALRGLGLALYRLGRYPEAQEKLHEALDCFHERDDPAGRAHTHLDIAWVSDRQGAHADALSHADRALALHRASGNGAGEAGALNAVGWFHAKLGEHETALARCEEAHALFGRLGDRIGAAATWDSLGYVNHELGRYDRAIECYGRAVELFRDAGDRYHEAESLRKLSGAFLAAADTDHAYGHGRSALRILDELGHPDADEVRHHLAHLSPG